MCEFPSNDELKQSIELSNTTFFIFGEMNLIPIKYIFEMIELFINHTFDDVLIVMSE